MIVATRHLRPAILDEACLQFCAPRMRRSLALLIIVVGVYGQIHDSLMPPASPWSDLHVGFGALLLCGIAVRMKSRVTLALDNRAEDFFGVRHLSTLVYLLLYALAGVREVADIGVYLGHGGTFDLGWIVVGNPGLGPPPLLSTIDSFQIYVIYGMLAILLIRANSVVSLNRVQ